jgi:hypothetical protein
MASVARKEAISIKVQPINFNIDHLAIAWHSRRERIKEMGKEIVRDLLLNSRKITDKERILSSACRINP